MRDLSQTFKNILATGQYMHHCRVEIAGEVYDRDRLIEMEISASLFGEGSVTIGQAAAATISLQVFDRGENMPKMAEIRPYIKLVGADGQESEWIEKGVFYVDTRRYNEKNGALSITGYDAMKLADQPYLRTEVEWSKTTSEVIAEICTRLGVTLDPRTDMPTDYAVPYPGTDSQALTIREVLQGIAAMYGGNWTMTDKGQLRLIRLNTLPSGSGYLSDTDGGHILVGGEHVHV